uniref:Heptahelical transmembrane protein 4 n=1 Tax=Ananas comosus var. bracteatus TaxID=296719 RepID=A0A6V7Q451_ANACO|nr:unnamed protein product [Ananas comosus var. bracteatus]
MATTVMTLEKTTIVESEAKFLLTPLRDGERTEEKMKKKKKSSCHEHKCELIGYDALPDFLKHNEFILDYYRSEWPLKEAFLSIFSIHNETLNVWTHLIGFFLFLSLAILTATMVPTRRYEDDDERERAVAVLRVHGRGHVLPADEQRLPPAVVPLGARLLRAAPAGLRGHRGAHRHLLLPARLLLLRLRPLARTIYVSLITTVGAAVVVVSLTPAFERPRFRQARAALFACMGLSGLVPILHKVAVYGDRPEAMAATAYEMGMGACYAVGVALYAARVPERWMPGMFDIAGHSHQLFHVLVIAGAYCHYLAGLVYLRWRDVDGCLL